MRFRLDLTDVADDKLETAIIKIPKQVTELDLSQNRLDKKPIATLCLALMKLHENVLTLDLRKNNLGNMEDIDLDLLLLFLPGTLKTLDLRDNHIEQKSSSALATVIADIPKTITAIAYNRDGFMSRTTIDNKIAALTNPTAKTNYSFYLKCIAALSMVTAVTGILLVNPVLIITGFGLMLASAVGLTTQGLFSVKTTGPSSEGPVVLTTKHCGNQQS